MRTQTWQYNLYLEFITEHPQLFHEASRVSELYGLWKDLANELNKPETGAPVRKIDEWRIAFRQWKHAINYKKRKFDAGDTSTLPSGRLKYKPNDLEVRALRVFADSRHKQNGESHVEHVEPPKKREQVVVLNQPMAAKQSSASKHLPEADKPLASRADKIEMTNKRSIPKQNAQYELYLKYAAKYPYLINGKHHADYHIQWVHLAEKLNTVGCANKTTDQWKNTFRHWKNNVRYKASRINEQQKHTSVDKPTQLSLTKLEQRALLAWRGEDVDMWRKDSSSDDEPIGSSSPQSSSSRPASRDAPFKTARCRPTLPQQYELYMQHVDKHPELISGAASTYELNQLWAVLAAELNTYEKGPVKSPSEWHRTFHTWKITLTFRARKFIDEGKANQMSTLETRFLDAWNAYPCKTKYLVDDDWQVGDNEPQNADDSDGDWAVEQPKRRRRQTLSSQYELFLEHVSVHPQLMTNDGDPATNQLLWTGLVTALNSNGQSKTMTEWKTVFHEWKKAVTLKEKQSFKPLTDLEQRALTIFSRLDISADDASESRKATVIRLHSCQFAMLMKFATKHPEVRTGHGDPGVFNRLWDEMAAKLNAFGSGPIRSVTTWKNTFWLWRRSLLNKLRKHQANTGDAELPVACKLSDFERQAIGLFVGRSCISAMGLIGLNDIPNIPPASGESKTLYDCCDENGGSQAPKKKPTLIQATRCMSETQPPVFVSVDQKPAVRRVDRTENKIQPAIPTRVENTADTADTLSLSFASADRRLGNHQMANIPTIPVADRPIKPDTSSSSKIRSPDCVSVEGSNQSQLRLESYKQMACSLGAVADRIGDLTKGVADSNALMRAVLKNQEILLQKLLDR